MTPWQQFLTSAAELAGLIVCVAALAWAAIARGRAHHWWRRLQHELGDPDRHLPHWCAAVGTVAGCA
jgi:hypothetical protein